MIDGEGCEIGLHSFTPWHESKGTEERQCIYCRKKEVRSFQREQRPPYDPYAELHG